MKQYSFMIVLFLPLSICAQNFNEPISENEKIQNTTEENRSFALEFDDADLGDAEDQIPSHALSEEDISLLIFDETELHKHNLQEDPTDTSIITQEEINLLGHNAPAQLISEKNSLEEKQHPSIAPNPEELFSTSIQEFILTHNIASKETLSSAKKAKLQGKLLAQHMQDTAKRISISFAQAKNITQNYIQKKCQDLNLGITNIEKKSLKTLLKQL